MTTCQQIITYALENRDMRKWPKLSTIAAYYGCSATNLSRWRDGGNSAKFDDLNGILEMLGFKLIDVLIELEKEK